MNVIRIRTKRNVNRPTAADVSNNSTIEWDMDRGSISIPIVTASKKIIPNNPEMPIT
jgi:hypothetical protein